MSDTATRFSGKRLLELRLRAGLSQSQLARKANIGEQQITRWEREKHTPSATAVGVLAAALGCEVGDLYVSGDGADEDEEDDRVARLRRCAEQVASRGHGDLAVELHELAVLIGRSLPRPSGEPFPPGSLEGAPRGLV